MEKTIRERKLNFKNYNLRSGSFKNYNSKSTSYQNHILENNTGITLIALIVTIIVLLILAGVSISAIGGGEGIFSRTTEVAFKTELAKIKEEYEIYVADKMIENTNFQRETLSAYVTSLYYNTMPDDEVGNVYTVLKNSKQEEVGKFEITKGELYYTSPDEKERKWAQDLGIKLNPYIVRDGVLLSCADNLGLAGDDTGTLVIPETVGGKPVTKIATGAFANVKGSDKSLKKIIIPGSVKEIESNAFSHNEALEEVYMQEGVEKINSNAFSDCDNLEKVHIANTVYTIGGQAFASNPKLTTINIPVNEKMDTINGYVFMSCKSLKTIEIPDNIETITGYAFISSGLTEIKIPKGTKKIEITAFSSCKDLKNIIIDEENEYFIFKDGIMMKKDETEMLFVLESAIKENTFVVPDKITKLNGNLISNYNNKITIVKIPASVLELTTAFFSYNTNITSIVIDDNNPNYMSDGKGIYNKNKTKLICYYDKSAEVATIPEGVTTIGEYAFGINRLNVTSIIFPESLTTIESQVFLDCNKLTEISLGKNVKYIDGLMLYSSSVSKINLNNENPYIAIKGATAKVGEVEKQVNILYTKDEKKLITVYPPTRNDYTSFTIPDEIKEIGNRAFHYWGKLKSITIPNTVTKIESSFINCTSLTSITIPKNVETISTGCFSGCANLKEIIIQKSEGSIVGAPWGATTGGRVEIKWQG